MRRPGRGLPGHDRRPARRMRAGTRTRLHLLILTTATSSPSPPAEIAHHPETLLAATPCRERRSWTRLGVGQEDPGVDLQRWIRNRSIKDVAHTSGTGWGDLGLSS